MPLHTGRELNTTNNWITDIQTRGREGRNRCEHEILRRGHRDNRTWKYMEKHKSNITQNKWGDPNPHSVLAGRRHLTTQKMFSDIIPAVYGLKKNYIITINVASNVLCMWWRPSRPNSSEQFTQGGKVTLPQCLSNNGLMVHFNISAKRVRTHVNK